MFIGVLVWFTGSPGVFRKVCRMDFGMLFFEVSRTGLRFVLLGFVLRFVDFDLKF